MIAVLSQWKQMRPDLILRPFIPADLPMMAAWLATPAVRRWWGEPAEQLALVSDDLDNPLMDQKIACPDAAPFGYLQSYPCAAWGPSQFADMSDDARAVDSCIGVSVMLSKGFGSAMLRLYAQTLLASGAPAVVIDPDPSNERAVRSYRRAGFQDIAIRPDQDGDWVLVMRFDPHSLW